MKQRRFGFAVDNIAEVNFMTDKTSSHPKDGRVEHAKSEHSSSEKSATERLRQDAEKHDHEPTSSKNGEKKCKVLSPEHPALPTLQIDGLWKGVQDGVGSACKKVGETVDSASKSIAAVEKNVEKSLVATEKNIEKGLVTANKELSSIAHKIEDGSKKLAKNAGDVVHDTAKTALEYEKKVEKGLGSVQKDIEKNIQRMEKEIGAKAEDLKDGAVFLASNIQDSAKRIQKGELNVADKAALSFIAGPAAASLLSNPAVQKELHNAADVVATKTHNAIDIATTALQGGMKSTGKAWNEACLYTAKHPVEATVVTCAVIGVAVLATVATPATIGATAFGATAITCLEAADIGLTGFAAFVTGAEIGKAVSKSSADKSFDVLWNQEKYKDNPDLVEKSRKNFGDDSGNAVAASIGLAGSLALKALPLLKHLDKADDAKNAKTISSILAKVGLTFDKFDEPGAKAYQTFKEISDGLVKAVHSGKKEDIDELNSAHPNWYELLLEFCGF